MMNRINFLALAILACMTSAYGVSSPRLRENVWQPAAESSNLMAGSKPERVAGYFALDRTYAGMRQSYVCSVQFKTNNYANVESRECMARRSAVSLPDIDTTVICSRNVLLFLRGTAEPVRRAPSHLADWCASFPSDQPSYSATTSSMLHRYQHIHHLSQHLSTKHWQNNLGSNFGAGRAQETILGRCASQTTLDLEYVVWQLRPFNA